MLPIVLDPTTLTPIEGKPAVGRPFLDPSFGTTMVRITGAPPSEGENAIIKPMYSTIQPWNADESLLILWHRNKGHELYLGDAPYTYIRNLNISPTDIEHVIWDPVEPFVFYYPTTKNQGRNQIIKVTLGQGGFPTETVLYDFSSPPTNCPITATGNRFGLGADPEFNFGPRKLLGLMCGSFGRLKIVYSIAENRVITSQMLSDTVGPTAPIVTPSETKLYWGGGYVTDLAVGFLRRLTAAFYFEHSQVGADAAGDNWCAIAFNQSSPGANDAGTLVCHSLEDASRKVIIGPATGYPYIASLTHISQTGPKGMVFVGSVGGARTGAFTGDNELMVAYPDTGIVCRVGHNRTWAGACLVSEGCIWGYWSETHGPLSRKGTRALFGSDWKGSSSVDTYVLDLRVPPVKVRVKNLCAIKSLSPNQFDCVSEGYEIVP